MPATIEGSPRPSRSGCSRATNEWVRSTSPTRAACSTRATSSTSTTRPARARARAHAPAARGSAARARRERATRQSDGAAAELKGGAPPRRRRRRRRRHEGAPARAEDGDAASPETTSRLDFTLACWDPPPIDRRAATAPRSRSTIARVSAFRVPQGQVRRRRRSLPHVGQDTGGQNASGGGHLVGVPLRRTARSLVDHYPRTKSEDDAVGAPRLVLRRWDTTVVPRRVPPAHAKQVPKRTGACPAAGFPIGSFGRSGR